MAEDALLTALDEDARAQADFIIQGAEAEAAALIKSAGEEAGVMLDAMLAQAARSVGRLRAEMMNDARVRASAALIDCRRALMDDVFERSLVAFSVLERTEYGRILNLWYDELKAAWDKAGMAGEPVVHVNPVDGALIDKSSVLLKPDPAVSLGLVFVSSDGRVRLENTFSTRLNKAKEDLVPLIDSILFSDGSRLNGRSKE